MVPEIWAVQVTTGEEARTAERIRRRADGLRAFAPRRELYERRRGAWSLAARLMLPGYLFIEIPEGADRAELWHRARRADGVLRIVGALSGADRQRLRTLNNGGQPWGISRCRQIEGRAQVYEGPLAGREDWIESCDRHRRRARVRLCIGGETHRIDLGLVWDA